MNSAVTALDQLLTAFRNIQEAEGRRSREALDGFIQQASSLSDRIREERRHSADRFNIFEALGMYDGELQHSVFIAYLLNPREHHDQGVFFLRSFLDHVGLAHMRPQENDPGIFV
jgi:hypothetical protein